MELGKGGTGKVGTVAVAIGFEQPCNWEYRLGQHG